MMMPSVSVFDSGLASSIGGAQSSVSQVAGALQSIGIINSDTAKALQVASGALQVVVGMLGIAQVLQSRMIAKTAEETARSAALVAANSWNPVGWTNIAVATAATAAASIGMYALVRTISADLSTPTGRQEAIMEAVNG